MIMGCSGSSGYQAYIPGSGVGQLQSPAQPVQPVNDQSTLKSGEGQGGAGIQVTALAKANELQNNIIDLFA